MKKHKLLYVYDALCGWCYGFSATIEKFTKTYEEELEVEVLSGGMVTGERVGPIGQVAAYISEAYRDVQKTTGVKFGEPFLNHTLKKGEAIFTSVPPAIAMSIYKSSDQSGQLTFASRLQKGIYNNGHHPDDLTWYGDLAQEFGWEARQFIEKMQQEEPREKAETEFRRAQAMGISGFPTVIVQTLEKYYLIGRGAVPFDRLCQNYESLKKELSA